MPDFDLDPATIRALRGPIPRAEFARMLGVTAHTIYRWEAPIDSPHARTPRGDHVSMLRELLTGSPAEADASSLPVATALQRMLDGDWRDAEGQFLRALSDRDASGEARVLAATGLALIELMFRADGRRALAALGPALSPGAPPLALAEATAALAYAHPDGELFDLGQVHAHVRRAEELARGGDALAIAMSLMAEATSGLLAGDDDLLLRASTRMETLALDALPVIPAIFLEQYRAMGATLRGQMRLATERLDRVLARPELSLSPPLEARVCAMRAMRLLDDLGDPQTALDLSRRAHRIAVDARLAVGVHTALALRSEAEALLRLGRLADADTVFAEADRIFAELGFPVTIVFPVQQRYLLAMGRADALDALAAKVGSVELPSMRAICHAYAAWIAATAALARGADPDATIAAFLHAERLVASFSMLRRELLVSFAGAALVDGDLSLARAVVGRALRAADQRPTAWMSAHLRRAEGTLLVAEGRTDEGITLFEAALATFEAGGDRLDAALAGFGAAGMSRALGMPNADERITAADANLVALGMPRPGWIERAIARASRATPLERTRGPDSLELALQRLAVAGATTQMVLRELSAVAEELVGAPVVIETDDADDPQVVTWFEISGGGRHLRLGITRDADRSALRLVALVAGLALEVAALRGGERAASAPEGTTELPGVIAASPAMRRVIGDVSRLAASRATVVITGESGVGKEVVARALHELSPRAAKPYVPFNCAAVPHDLFEGQLFGYRKGAFTGATADHLGVLRAADHGSVFLDEIGELPPSIQPKLLRFLDSGEVFPLGAQRPVTVDVRVIAATNRDLAAEVRAGRFREDLYYRLQVVPIVVPPLRERREDIVPLARHFARTLAEGPRAPAFAPDALAVLTAHAWPGNVRELRNAIARAIAYAPNRDVITRAMLGL